MDNLSNFKDWGPAWLIALTAVLGLIWLIRWQANTLTSLFKELIDVIRTNTVAWQSAQGLIEKHEDRAQARHQRIERSLDKQEGER